MYLRDSKLNRDKSKICTNLNQSTSKFTPKHTNKSLMIKKLNTELDDDLIKQMSTRIEDLNSDSRKPRNQAQSFIKQNENEETTDLQTSTDSNQSNELINKAKIQMEKLNKSFDLLIKNQLDKCKNVSYDQLEFEQKHKQFNQRIKAYVDVCCNSPHMVTQFPPKSHLLTLLEIFVIIKD